MNDELKIVNLLLGDNLSQPIFNKTSNIQLNDILDYNNLQVPKTEIDSVKLPGLIEVTKPSKIESIQIPHYADGNMLSDIKPGYTQIVELECLKPSILEQHLKIEEPRDDSIMDTVESGFGIEKILRKECTCNPKYKLHLCKENYLGEFKKETEKKLARTNLGVYSQQEVNTLLESLITQSEKYVTHTLLETIISDLDFVNSTLKAVTDYEIPKLLFKL